MNAPPKGLGKLRIEVDSDSVFFGHSVPIEIRDSRMRLVEHAASEREFKLPIGLYQVSAILEDGQEHTELVKISQGDTTTTRIGPFEQEPLASKVLTERPTGSHRYKAPRFTQRVETIDETEMEPAAEGIEVQLLDVQGAKMVRDTRTLWIFECEDAVDSVPAATVKVGDTTTVVSLPTSPGGGPTPNLCAVRVEKTTTGVRATSWISPERTVANALQNMLASGRLPHAAQMADEATELLRDKYSDPTGATLGALILHKVGRLNRLQSWVENLVNDFGWIPDAKILLAVMLFDDRSDLAGALELATQASQQRILYAECYSILLDLLRRWPEEYEWELRVPSLMALTEQSSYVDWESICLTVRREEDDDA